MRKRERRERKGVWKGEEGKGREGGREYPKLKVYGLGPSFCLRLGSSEQRRYCRTDSVFDHSSAFQNLISCPVNRTSSPLPFSSSQPYTIVRLNDCLFSQCRRIRILVLDKAYFIFSYFFRYFLVSE